MIQYLQRIGKAIMLPIAALPIAGILLGIGGALLGISELTNAPALYKPIIEFINISFVRSILKVMSDMGNCVFKNLPILFAVGVAVGVAKKDRGTAALASVLGFIVMNQVISTLLELGVTQLGVITPDNVREFGAYVTTNLGIFTLNMSVFGGIITGIITAILHDRFHDIQLPQVMGFFAGSRFVHVVTAITMAFVGAILAFIWPAIQNCIGVIANLVRNAGGIGIFFFGVIERALIPFGLHHVFYTPFWFGSFVDGKVLINDSWQSIAGANTSYFAQLSSMTNLVGASPETMTTIISGTTKFMAGKFPFMMFGLPAAAFAMYRCAEPSNKKNVGSILLAAGITSLLTGITEPLEFTFIFVAPVLYGVHCLLAGLSFVIMDFLRVFIGMTFSGGLIDFCLFGLLPAGVGVPTRWEMVLIVGVVYAFIYYFLFTFIINKFDLKTPGRDKNEQETKLHYEADFHGKNTKEGSIPVGKFTRVKVEIKEKAPAVLEAFGGKLNVISVDSCVTRLRVEVKDKSKVDKDELKTLGALGVMEVGNGIQAIFGAKAEGYKNALNDILESK
ncbi:MAG: PTS glucose transporter subunit IIB [Clostridium butyricum]|nr:PTS glucose transporter subunit IIB [Clostridium butyricum]